MSSRGAFLNGWLFGSIYLGFVFSWILASHPAVWAGIESPATSLFLVAAAWLFMSVVLGIMLGLWAMTVAKTVCGKSFLQNIFLIPVLWVVFEYARAIAFSLLWAGDGGLLGAQWSFGVIGYALAQSDALRFIASLGGVYLLSFFVLGINVAFFYLLLKKKCSSALLALLLLALIAYMPLRPAPAHTNTSLRFAVIHTERPSFFSVPLKTFTLQSEKMFSLLLSTVSQSPDVIILPEDSRVLLSLTENQIAVLRARAGEKEMLIIDSSRVDTPGGKPHSVIVFFNTKTGLSTFSQKELLTPGGEYLPAIATLLSSLSQNTNWQNSFEKNREYAKADFTNMARYKGITISARFCSEVISPSLYAKDSREGAGILTNVASHTAFGSSEILYSQTRAMAQIHASANGRYYVQAGNGARSFALDNQGNILTESTHDEGVFFQEIQPLSSRTVYLRFGDWVVFLSLLFLVLSHARTQAH